MIEIRPFDATTASDDDLRAPFELSRELEAELEPDDPPTPFGEFAAEVRTLPSWMRAWSWLAFDGRDLVGWGWVYVQYREDNQHLATVQLRVPARHRRRGVGRRLLAEAATVAAAEGRTMLETDAADGGPADGFLAAHGFEKRYVERRSRLRLADVDRDQLAAWVAQAQERASDYELIGFDDRCPDDLLEGFVELGHVMNTAPREDLDMEDERFTAAMHQEAEDRILRQGGSIWTLVARHRPTGALAGYTAVHFNSWRPALAWQGDTGVQPAHRERGLGRWVKAAMLQRILAERPEVEVLDTWNADSNAAMLGINVALGFRPLRMYGEWQAPRADVQSVLDAPSVPTGGKASDGG